MLGGGYEIWDKLHELGLVQDLMDISEELCLRRSELIRPSR